jgi:3',5'-cyclic AMP phosphodiesterase CpdA
MLTRKYADISTSLILIFVCLGGCVDRNPEHSVFNWIGLDSESKFEIRSLPNKNETTQKEMDRLSKHAQKLTSRAKDRCINARFAVIGDSRAAYDDLGVSIYWPGMLKQMEELKPDLILHVGDLVKNGSRANEWLRYLNTLPQLTPIVAVRGNHDRGNYFYEWRIGVSPVFKLDFGPVRLIGLDSEGGAERVRQRLGKFEAHLSEPTDRWKIVFLHRPIWSQGLHGSDELKLNNQLVSLFDAHGVVLVLSGHDHNYERFCPSKSTSEHRRCRSDDRGTHYVVSGGGATMPNPIPAFWRRWTDSSASKLVETSRMFSGDLHFIELNITDARFAYRVHKSPLDGFGSSLTIIDEFQITREPPACP